MAQSSQTRKGSPTKADYRTVDPFHAFAVIGRSIRDLLVKFNIIHPKPAKKTGKSSKQAKRKR